MSLSLDSMACRMHVVWKSGIPETQNSGFPEFRNSGFPEFRISGKPKFRLFGTSAFWDIVAIEPVGIKKLTYLKNIHNRMHRVEPVGIPESQKTGIPENRDFGIPDFRKTRIPDFRNSGFPEIRNFGIPDFRTSGPPFPVTPLLVAPIMCHKKGSIQVKRPVVG